MSLAHFFVPRESNNQKAKLLHATLIFGLAFLLLAYQLGINILPSLRSDILGYAANISVDEVVRLTNQKRAEAGLGPLRYNAALAGAAYKKGEHMLGHDYWAHVAPDGTEPWKFFIDSGYRYKYAGENLARDFSDAGSAVEAWMASPSHKENMLSPKYREIGVAVVEGDLAGVDTTIIVQFFGMNAADKLPTAPVAKAGEVPSPTPIAIALSTPAPEPAKVLISPFRITRDMTLGLVGLLSGVMLVDSTLVSKRRISRIGGRTFAHLAFLGMIGAIILIAKAGKIL